MNDRGQYGNTHVGASSSGGSSKLWWIAVLGGAVLWGRHQAKQIESLNEAAGLPHQSFWSSVRQDARQLSSATRERLRGFEQRLGAGRSG